MPRKSRRSRRSLPALRPRSKQRETVLFLGALWWLVRVGLRSLRRKLIRDRRHRRRLNVQLLVRLVAAALLVGAALWAVHSYQVWRNASAYLFQADAAEAQARELDAAGSKGLLAMAAIHLGRYLEFVPADTDQLERYGCLLETLAATPDARRFAQSILEKVLRTDPQRRQARRGAARLALDLGMLTLAREHLEQALKDQPDNGEVNLLFGRYYEAAKDPEKAALFYEQAIRHAPGDLQAYLRLANAYRQQRAMREAEQALESLVKANPDSVEAYLLRARFRRLLAGTSPEQQVELNRAAADLATAQKLLTATAKTQSSQGTALQAAVLLELAELALARDQADQARALLQQGIRDHPCEVPLYLALARVEERAARWTDVVATLREGLRAVPRHPDLMWALAEALLDNDEPDEAAELIDSLRRRGAPAPIEYLDALRWVKLGVWGQAIAVLERIRPLLEPTPRLHKHADFYLAYCHRQLGNTDLQLAAYQHALDLDPLWVPARVGLAATYLDLGRFAEALQEYRKALPRWPRAGLEVARLLMQYNLTVPPQLRRWDEVEAVLEAAAAQLPDRVEVALVRAEILVARDRAEEAARLLEEECRRRPQQSKLWAARAEIAQLQGHDDRARALLEEGRQQAGDGAELRLARLRLGAKRRGVDAVRFFREAEQELEHLPPHEQARVLRAVAEAFYEVGNNGEARRVWQRLAEQQLNDLRSRLILFNFALEAGEESSLKRLIEEIRNIEGSTGTLWRYGQAAYALEKARQGDRSLLAEARQLLTEVVTRRPNWSQAALLAAHLDELQHDTVRALDNYLKAVELGERHPRVIRRTVQLLFERQRYLEARQTLRKLEEKIAYTGDLRRLAAEISLETREYAQALEQAREAVAEGSKDYRDYVWLGQMLAALQRGAEAEAALRRAVALAPDNPEPWAALMLYLVRAGQSAAAEQLLHEVRAKLAWPTAAALLGQGWELLGRADRAEAELKAGLQAAPFHPGLVRALADFYQRTNRPTQAESLLRQLMEPAAEASESDVHWARRSLALIVGARPEYAAFQEALALLEHNLASRGPNPDDLGVQAVILASRPSHRRQAIQVLEELSRRQPLTIDQHQLLARLYEEGNDWAPARTRWLGLLAREPDNPAYLARYIHLLVQLGSRDDLLPWLKRLEEAEPDSERTLEARLVVLRCLGRSPEVLTAIDPYLKRRDARPDWLLARLDELGFTEAADLVHSVFAAKSDKPEWLLARARHLALRQRTAEALQLCRQVWKAVPEAQAARTAVAVLRTGRPTDEQQRLVESWLQEALRHAPGSVPLLLSLAELRDHQGRYAEVEQVYRQILQHEPLNSFALNNLAWYLTLRTGNGTEALELLDRAVQRFGPSTQMLDTRALAWLALGKPEQAVRDLQTALAQKPNFLLYFHLAQAYILTRDKAQAAEALRKAKELGLKPALLHPLERGPFGQLVVQVDDT